MVGVGGTVGEGIGVAVGIITTAVGKLLGVAVTRMIGAASRRQAEKHRAKTATVTMRAKGCVGKRLIPRL